LKIRNRDAFYGLATPIDHGFDDDQRRTIYGWIVELEDTKYKRDVWVRALGETIHNERR
jgi:hypothetical protein